MRKLKSNAILLRELREDAGYSRKQLSNLSGISETLIKQLETGVKSINKISLDKAFKLAVIFAIPIEYFVDPTQIKLNTRYMRYYSEMMEEVFECYPLDSNGRKYCIPYSKSEDPYEKLEEIFGKEIEELKTAKSQKEQDDKNE